MLNREKYCVFARVILNYCSECTMEHRPEHYDMENDLSEFDIYGKTPPRTKILRKNREKKHRHDCKHDKHGSK